MLGNKKFKERREEEMSKKEVNIVSEMEGINELDLNLHRKNGEYLNENKKCPRCGNNILMGADICESCGRWLNEGQCKFCYTPLEEGANYCAECGNPVKGIECPKCHNIDYFDFCKNCGIPLTKQAIQAVENLKRSEEFSFIKGFLENGFKNGDRAMEQQELANIKKYEEKFKKGERKKGHTQGSMNQMKILEVEKQKVDEKKEYQKNLDAFISNTIKQVQQKTFANNQEARRFYGALKVILPIIIIKKNPKGWKCNAYDVIHPDGPQACAAAEMGGEWIYEYEEERGFEEVEI